MEDWEGCIRFESGAFGVAFVGHVVRGRNLWEVMVVMGMRFGSIVLHLMLLCCGIFDIFCKTTSLMIWSITVWKDAKRWLKFR